jgi:hypothetical protein
MRRHRRRGGETKNEEKQRPRRSNVESLETRSAQKSEATLTLVVARTPADSLPSASWQGERDDNQDRCSNPAAWLCWRRSGARSRQSKSEPPRPNASLALLLTKTKSANHEKGFPRRRYLVGSYFRCQRGRSNSHEARRLVLVLSGIRY